MDEVKVFVFRVNCDVPYIKDELEKGRLRQGWGWDGTNLEDAQKDNWVKAQCEKDDFEDNDKYYKRKFNNLKIMCDIKEGDILIIPKMPDQSHFTICKAVGKYEFRDPIGYDRDDFRHVIPIDVDSKREFSYRGNEDCRNIHAKLRAYQSPVNNVWNETIRDVANKLANENISSEEMELSEVIEGIKTDSLKITLDRLRNLGNKDIEKIVELIFVKLGYEYTQTNSFDNNGGDADAICNDVSLSEFFEVSANGGDIAKKIYVQIKNKYGRDKDDKHGVDQLITRTQDEPNAVKILISTTDEFSSECKKHASANDVLLIDSTGFLKLVFKYLD